MRRHNRYGMVGVAFGCLGVALFGCEAIQSPSSELEKAPGSGAGELAGNAVRAIVTKQPATPATPAQPGRPFKGKIKSFDPLWFVSHFAEETCGDRVAGTDAEVGGNFTHMGKTEGHAAAAWDWGTPAAGRYAPEGPATGSSATILAAYPYDFCSAERSASGQVVLERKNGDQVFGVVVGGEVYELGFVRAGDAQEQFIEIDITGGTGRFEAARGRFVFHAVVHLVGETLMKGEILDGGRIAY